LSAIFAILILLFINEGEEKIILASGFSQSLLAQTLNESVCENSFQCKGTKDQSRPFGTLRLAWMASLAGRG
jgi:hypothetical protein